MKEAEQILALWAELEAKDESAVLATVVKTSGSSYRLPGARLMLTRTGQRVGSVSGGCLEDDLVKKAWWLTENGPLVRRYDTTPDGEIAAEYGLGCNGIIHVLLERVKPGAADALSLMRRVRDMRRPAAIAYIIAPANAVGQKLAIDVDGRVQNELSTNADADAIEAASREALGADESRHVRLEDGTEFFAETLQPALRLLIFGAGDDAVPLVRLAKFLGWQVFVFDGRAHYARTEKFPGADCVTVRRAGEDDSSLPIDHWTAAVLMSHSYAQDFEILKQLADEPLRYLGVLGPRKRAVQMLSEAGIASSIDAPRIHSPMGLDIGADGPEQVALSVVAEIQAKLNGRQGGFLRHRAGSIHTEEPGSDIDTARSAWTRSIACV
jgi:xanthine/CO dehydrogenase XdhC/CoxF family maturation factor